MPYLPSTEEGLKARYIDVTPAQARRWLRQNTRNRPLRQGQVNRYAKLMKRGEWLTSPDAIAFDEEGRLINGQHRLEAIRQAGETAENVLVATGLPTGAFKIADVGAKRTAADVLHIEGYHDVQELGAVLKLVVLWVQGRLEKSGEYEVVEKSEIVTAAELCTDRIYESMDLVRTHKEQLKNALPRSIAAFAHFIYKPTFQDRADEFVWEAYGETAGQPDWIEIGGEVKTVNEWAARGVDISEYGGKINASAGDHEDRYPSPAKLLRAKIDRNAVVPREKWCAWTIQAMNWYCTREPHGGLRYRASDRFPEPRVDMIPELEDGSGLADSPS